MATTLGKNANVIFTSLCFPGLLAACAQMGTYETGKDSAGQVVIQNTMTSNEHKTLAKYHQDKAEDLRVKVKEKKQLLEHYEDKSHLYGKRAQDLQTHIWALIRNYEQAATANTKEAAAQRRIASELERNSNSVSSPQKIEGLTNEILRENMSMTYKSTQNRFAEPPLENFCR